MCPVWSRDPQVQPSAQRDQCPPARCRAILTHTSLEGLFLSSREVAGVRVGSGEKVQEKRATQVPNRCLREAPKGLPILSAPWRG